MRRFRGIADRDRTRGRGILGLFAAVWLNLALAPCAMAYETDDDHQSMHSGHHAGMVAEMPCADDLSDCSLEGEFSLDTRTGASKLKHVPIDMPVAIVGELPLTLQAIPQRQRAPPQKASAPCRAAPPLYLLNCVFLD